MQMDFDKKMYPILLKTKYLISLGEVEKPPTSAALEEEGR